LRSSATGSLRSQVLTQWDFCASQCPRSTHWSFGKAPRAACSRTH